MNSAPGDPRGGGLRVDREVQEPGTAVGLVRKMTVTPTPQRGTAPSVSEVVGTV